ncbi:MAG: choice-of-anchor J domain-containing protein [Candidatus Zophobacter franzmannii]|nr:choice-of-anchor J domain-containing protein [Candidatus Zophobacter franzmannii]
MKKISLLLLLTTIISLLTAFGGDGIMYGGYYYANSVEQSDSLVYQPTFEWVNLGVNAIIPNFTNSDDDDGYAQVQLGFNFTFFGNDYDMIYLGTNGYCQFTNPISTHTAATGMMIPDLSAPNNVIALCTMDLQTGFIPSQVSYGNDEEGNFVYSVESWNDYDDTSERMDIQLILFPNGKIKIQYDNYVNPMNDTGPNSMLGDGCIGIESITGVEGHQYRNNGIGNEVVNGMALSYALSEEDLSDAVGHFIVPELIDFDAVQIGVTSETIDLIVHNPTASDLVVPASPTVIGDDANRFFLTDNYTYPLTILAGSDAVYPIVFLTNSDGYKVAYIALNEVGIGEPYEVELNGYGYLNDNNNTSASASAIPSDSDAGHEAVIAPIDDIDWYVFMHNAPATIIVHTEHLNGSTVDLTAHLYGPYTQVGAIVDENNVFVWDDNSWTDGVNPSFAADCYDSGFYYLRIARADNPPNVTRDRIVDEYTLWVQSGETPPEPFIPAPPQNLEVNVVYQGAHLIRDFTETVMGTLSGFNIYRDDVLINTEIVTDTTYIDDAENLVQGQSYEYKVTSENIWPDTESGPCDSVVVVFDAPTFGDTFETYEDFSTEFGLWTNLDIDGQNTYTFGNWIDFPHEGEALSFMIFNSTGFTPPLPNFAAYSGDKFASSICCAGAQNDNWLITPQIQLSDEDVTVGFMARSNTIQYGMEEIQIGVSTTGSNPEDFTIITGVEPVEIPLEWTSFTYSLNQYQGQAIRIGINHNSTGTMMLMLDDFSFSNIGGVVGVDEYTLPNQSMALIGNYPNPFNPETTIKFSIDTPTDVKIDIFNIKGQQVKTIANSLFNAGSHSVLWNGMDSNGSIVPSGVYFYRMQSGMNSQVKKMILMK